MTTFWQAVNWGSPVGGATRAPAHQWLALGWGGGGVVRRPR